MIPRSDPLERLRAVNPVPFSTAILTAPDALLFQRIVAGETAGGSVVPSPGRRRARRLVPALLVTSLLGGAVAYGLMRGEVSKPHAVACYEAADLEADTVVVSADEGGALAACADLWRRGVLGAGGTVPPLAQCVLESGVAGVFPTTSAQDVCATLTLAPVPTTAPPGPGPTSPPAQGDVNMRFLAFRDAVLPQFVDAGCVEPGTGAAIVRRELDRAGLGDWTVRDDGFSAERPCATLSFQPERQEVVLVPAPPRR